METADLTVLLPSRSHSAAAGGRVECGDIALISYMYVLYTRHHPGDRPPRRSVMDELRRRFDFLQTL